jgi:hypothetical protein
MRRWTKDHGADGLRLKFHVYKARDRSSSYPDVHPTESRIGWDGEFVFVLRPETDEAAWDTLFDYANYVRHRAPQLYDDIMAQLSRIGAAQ